MPCEKSIYIYTQDYKKSLDLSVMQLCDTRGAWWLDATIIQFNAGYVLH